MNVLREDILHDLRREAQYIADAFADLTAEFDAFLLGSGWHAVLVGPDPSLSDQRVGRMRASLGVQAGVAASKRALEPLIELATTTTNGGIMIGLQKIVPIA